MEERCRNEKMLEAIRCFLDGSKVDWNEEIDKEDWAEFFRLCRRHQILPMAFEAVYACPAFASVPQDMVQMLRRQVIREIMLQNRKTGEFLELYKDLREAGQTPLVVKGLVCRSLYHEPDYRSSGDEDVLIPWGQFPQCHEVLEACGMKPAEPERDLASEGEVTYYKQGGALHIELHKELFSSESEAYGNLNHFFKEVFDRKIEMSVQGVTIYTMSHTDHLLYLILHAFKHFLHSGFGIRQVMDISIYAMTYGTQIDWNYVLDRCRDIHADVFAASLFDIGEKHLGFDRETAGYPERWMLMKADGEELLEDLLAGGVFGDSSLSRKHSSNITLQAVTDDKKGKTASASVLQSLFPDKRYMERNYAYLKSYPFLLPAAWIMRITRYVRESRRWENNHAGESLKIGNKRVDLMKKYKIIQ